MHADQTYLQLLTNILDDGIRSEDRTGVGTTSLFSPQMRFDLAKGFPLLTTKRVPFGLIKSELLWFLKGDTNIKYLLQHNNHIWDAWAFEKYIQTEHFTQQDPLRADFAKTALANGLNYRFNHSGFNNSYDTYMNEFIENVVSNPEYESFGELGPVYGKQWRDFNGIDQIQNVINQIKTNPESRRLIVSAWNPEDVPTMALPPCHMIFQFYVRNNTLSCHLYQRSGDMFLGIPFNIASYALLTHIIAKQTGLDVGELVMTIGDAHIYNNHIQQVTEQVGRTPRDLPTLAPFELKDLNAYAPGDFKLEGYDPHPSIKAPVAV